jgi:drug/metabolite transporter (DMT)-like permease
VLVGARLSSLIACTAPIFALAAEALLLRKYQFSALGVLGVLLTVAGVVWVVAERQRSGTHGNDVKSAGRTSGIVLAVLGSAAQGLGAVLTARAFETESYHPLAAVQIRMIAAIPAFVGFALLTGRLAATLAALRDRRAMLLIVAGAIGGPFLGVTFFTTSLLYVPPSITQTMVSLVPILLIPVVVLMGREKVSPRAVLGTVVAVAGVYVLIHSSP